VGAGSAGRIDDCQRYHLWMVVCVARHCCLTTELSHWHQPVRSDVLLYFRIGGVMKIIEFKAKKTELEANISSSVSELVEQFKEDTGYSPDMIKIRLIDVSTIGSEKPVFIVGKTSVYVEI
jgi:hypothetical protein